MSTQFVRAWTRGASVPVRSTFVACLLSALAACGGGSGGDSSGAVLPPPSADPGVVGAPYFPFAVGDRWRSVDGNTTLTTRVVGEGATGFLLLEESSDGSIEEILVARSDTAVSLVPRPSDDAFTAAIGRYDIARFPLRVGATYRAVDKAVNGGLDFDSDGRADNLQVRIDVTVVGFERVSVPAGSFDNALHQRTVITQTIVLGGTGRTVLATGTADDWYAPGVGPVRSVLVIDIDGQRETSEEVLQDYRVGNLRNDTTAPTVVSRTPADGSLGSNRSLQLVFSEAIERNTLQPATLTLMNGSGLSIPGRSEWADARTLVFVPEVSGGASADGNYTVSLDGVAEDWAGNRVAGPVQWGFGIDSSGPVLVAQSPLDGALDVATDAVLSFTFDETLLPASVTDAGVRLWGPEGQVPAGLSVEGRVLKVTPSAPLRAAQRYQLSISGLKDGLGNENVFTMATHFTTTRGDPGRYAFPEDLAAFGDRPLSLVRLADLNGDGRPDLLAAALNAGRTATEAVVVHRNADGTLASQATVLPGDACQAADLSLLDLDADGLTDVMGARSFCGAHWIQQSSVNSWAYRGSLGFSAEQLRAIRLVGQVRPGIVGLGNFDPTLVVLRPRGGAGTTEFEAPEVLVAGVNTVTRILQIADVNGDGREDIVMATGRDGQVLMALQRSDASFELRWISVPDADQVWLIADFDGDGRADLLVGESNPSFGLVVLLQQADGSFPPTGRRYLLTSRTSQALHADVDGDGRKEIVLAIGPDAATVANLAVFVPRSNGSFALLPLLQYARLPDWSAPYPGMPSFAAGEFSGEGPADLLFLGHLMRALEPVAVPTSNRGSTTGTMRALRSLDPAHRIQAR